MSIADYYDSEYQINLANFAALVNLASVDRAINQQEDAFLKRLAIKLDVSEDEYKGVLKNPNIFSIVPPYDLETRMERIHDLFGILHADHEIDEAEMRLIQRYAIALGFSQERAKEEILKCIKMFGNNTNFED